MILAATLDAAIVFFAAVGAWSTTETHVQTALASKFNQESKAESVISQETLPPISSNENKSKSETIWQKTTDDALTLYTFILAIFTAILAIVSIAQGYMLYRADKTARTSANASKISAETLTLQLEMTRNIERPFIFLKEILIRSTTKYEPVVAQISKKKLESVYFTPVLENGGTTPAHNVEVNFCMDIFEDDIPSSFEYPDDPDVRSTGIFIGPKTSIHAMGFKCDRATIEIVSKQQRRLFAWGWAEYNDIFSKSERHRTEFCVEINIEGDIDTEYFIATAIYGNFNRADSWCIRPPKETD